MTAPFNDRSHARAHVKPIMNGDVMICHGWGMVLIRPSLARNSHRPVAHHWLIERPTTALGYQQSSSLLAVGDTSTDFIHLFPITARRRNAWEEHGKIDRWRTPPRRSGAGIAGEVAQPGAMPGLSWGPLSKSGGVGGNPGSLRIFDLPNPYSAASHRSSVSFRVVVCRGRS
jgi:hypothetical protein